MTVYNLLMESFYYDGDGFTIVDVTSEIRTFGSYNLAVDCLERAIKEEIDNGKYTQNMLVRDGDDYACFSDEVYGDEGANRTLYRLTIYEREIES